MNHLGLMLAWCAVQVSLVLIPAAALHAFASRRGPSSGAWVASMTLGLIVAFSLLTLIPRGSGSEPTTDRAATSRPIAMTATRGEFTMDSPRSDPDVGPGWTIAGIRSVWRRFASSSAVPVDRCRRWGRALAFVALTGAGVGLLRLAVGVWAVHMCRRWSRPVDDPVINDLIEDLRAALGCLRRIEVRETPELTTPATAGWRRPVVLLPDDWRSWGGHERRAVFAHELAHVCRNDYLTGLVARVALTLHFYHPLVHWLAVRLQLEQELAADALGARFAGGKTLYLQSLSRLALRQDGRSPGWPVRAFLPAKGTLIRRIAMLRDETNVSDRPWSRPRRASAALLLMAVAAGASTLRGPARGDDVRAADDEVKTVKLVARTDDLDRVEPFDLSYLPDDAQGLVAFRPSAIFRRSDMGTYRTMLNLLIGQQWAKAANAIGFDPAKPGQGPLRVEMFEQVTTVVTFRRHGDKKPNRRIDAGEVITARTTVPIDWVALFRTFKQDLTEVREGDRVYYRGKNPVFGPHDYGIFCPDDRTVVFASEKRLLKLLRRKTPVPAPAFAKGKDWDQFLRGLVLVAFDNRDGRLAKILMNDESEDADVATLFKHVEQWTFGFENRAPITYNGTATCPDAVSSASTARATEALLVATRKDIDKLEPTKGPHAQAEEKARRMAREFLKKAQVERDGRSVLMRSTGLGTFADIASVIAEGFD